MSTPFHNRHGIRYGLMGLPLAFVALPLYVILPHHYASQYGVPLATLGLLLLLARFFDAAIDPWLGRWSDRQFTQSTRIVLRWGVVLAALLGLGFTLLFFPPVKKLPLLGVWLMASLLLTYVAFSALSILHQSWGARLGGDETQRSRIVAWREGLGLVGVLLASALPVAVGLPATTVVFFVALGLACWFWFRAPLPVSAASTHLSSVNIWLPFQRPAFRALLAVFIVNGIASAIPATLLLFFVQDRLQAPSTMEPVFLGSYFVCAALSIPIWLRLVQRMGLARSWLAGMVLSVSVFLFAASLGAGDSAGFIAVCALSGIGLGADLALPSALLAGVMQTSGDHGHAEGAYFGWWNFSTKLNLALAAGLALPILGALGYAPGSRDPAALQVLTWSYCLLPCALKLGAATLLYTLIIRRKA